MQEQVEAVQRMQDYIDAHLYEEITPAALSRASLYSPWYSYRLFRRWLNMTPADFVRRLRLTKTALRLRDEDVTVTDAALDSGFSSVDGFQRAFYREFGINPREYAQNPVPLYLFTPFGIKSAHSGKEEKDMQEVKSVFLQVIDKPARKAVIKRGVKAEDYFAYCEEVGCDVWGLLVSMKSLCGEPVCLWLPEALIKPGTSKYVQGVEVPSDFAGEVPDGFDVIDLPAAKYLMFQGEPFKEEDYEEAIRALWQAIERYEPSAIGYRWDKKNPRIQLEPIGTRGYIELLPIEKV